MQQRPGVFGVIALVLGIAGCLWTGTDLKHGWESRNWPTIEGQVIHSSIETKRHRSANSGTRTSYKPKIEYAYAVAGKSYTANTVAFGLLSGHISQARDSINRYPEGATVLVAYNPASPSTSALEPGINWSTIGLFIAALAALLLGAAALTLVALGKSHLVQSNA